ncbi:hypothetical protein H6G76_07975 [Nostoc sp. FACHB-152]|uniref:hypothetical protein n=1 Tax=unclassified Nostoc TaxID=2593658 RepID=UPI00168557D0|nr:MULTISPECIES: hypothetical protein [unclassified Nostoc]MBD2447104.1 hypothetical protein [Nostoc sp. FACHB-152]MBD2469217.1 hypothetical protein [Nostoc sp. FACHB-145]
MKPLALGSSLVAIVGSVVSLTLPATAINVVYFSDTTQPLNLPTIGGAELRLTQISLPPGKWIINYSASPVNNTANDIVRCFVRAKETGAIISGHATTAGVQPGASFVSTISGVTVVVLSEPTTMVLTCTHDNTGPAPYIDPGAEIAAY